MQMKENKKEIKQRVSNKVYQSISGMQLLVIKSQVSLYLNNSDGVVK